MADRLVLAAPAKINLYLAVGGRRPDGYHDVVTVLQALDLHDVLIIEPAPALTLSCDPDVCTRQEANLVWRAAESLAAAVGREPAFALSLRKSIPHGGGLGGGSADAAATLAGLADAWSLDPADPRIASVAAGLGADVPFFLEGGCALFDGRGDRLVRRLPAPLLDVVLVNPGVPVSTAEAYAALDADPPADSPAPGSIIAALESGKPEAIAETLYDGMTAASIRLVPAIADALATLRSCDGVLGTCMAGSGSTVFGVCADAASARAAALRAEERGWWAAATTTRDDGVRELADGPEGER